MPDPTAALAVLGEPGWRLLVDAGMALDAALDARGDVALGAATRLSARRQDAEPARRAAALELVTEGRRLAQKLGVDERLIAVRGAVEQASSGRVATWHASRLPPGCRVLEIGCGCGGDTLAIAHRAAHVIATDTDPVRAACAHMNTLAFGLGNTRAIPGDGLEVLAGDGRRADVVFADPDRRPHGRRERDPSAWSPGLGALIEVARGGRAVYVKAAPSLEADAALPVFRVTYVSRRRECVEAFLEPARDARSSNDRPAVEAVILPDEGPSIALSGDRADAPPGSLGEALYTVDPAAVRAHLLAELCTRHGLTLVGAGIAWLTGPAGVVSPWLRGYRVLDVFPCHPGRLRTALRKRPPSGIRTHCRGVAVNAQDLEKQLARAVDRRGGGPVVDVFATRIDGAPSAVLAVAEKAGGAA